MTEIESKMDIFPEFMETEPLPKTARMNSTIQRLLELFPNACFGGSSVLYDIVLPLIEKDDKYWKHWISRDFDIYCFDSDYSDIIAFLKICSNVHFIRTLSNLKKSSYANLDIINLREYSIIFDGGIIKKLQLVNVGKYSNYSSLYNSIDLSFCSVVISNNTIYYLRTTKTDILEKRGTLLIKPCMCESCVKNNKVVLNSKTVNRAKKYRARGFTITNLCQFCDYSMNRLEHVQCCLVGRLFSKRIDNLSSILHGTEKLKLGIDEINRLISYSHQYKYDSIILLSIYSIFAYFKRIDLVHSFWEEIKISIDIQLLMKCSELLVREGLYTGFRLLFEHLLAHHINTIPNDDQTIYICHLMESVIQNNYMQCALLIQSRIPTIQLDIYEDQIFSWKNRVIYEMLFELINMEDSSQSEIDSLMRTIPFIEKLGTNDPKLQEICPICKYDDCSIKMTTCGHSFCQNCIVLQLMTTYETSRKEMCPCCREEYHYLSKIGFDV